MGHPVYLSRLQAFRPFPFYKGYSAGLLRWQALRNEGRIAPHRAVHAEAVLSELGSKRIIRMSTRHFAAPGK